MAGPDSSIDKMLALAAKGAARKRAAETSPQPEKAREDPAVGGSVPDGARSKTKKPRAKGGEAAKAMVVPDGSVQVGKSTSGRERQPRPGPAWLDRLSVAAYSDPLQASHELFQVASDEVKQSQADRREKEAATQRVEELEIALKAANEKIASSDKELHLARKELKAAKEGWKAAKEEASRLDGLEEELRLAKEKVDDLEGWKKSWEADKADLLAELDEATDRGMSVLVESFNNAIAQVQFCHPDVSIDREIVHHSHEVIGDWIQKRGMLESPRSRRVFKRPGAP